MMKMMPITELLYAQKTGQRLQLRYCASVSTTMTFEFDIFSTTRKLGSKDKEKCYSRPKFKPSKYVLMEIS